MKGEGPPHDAYLNRHATKEVDLGKGASCLSCGVELTGYKKAIMKSVNQVHYMRSMEACRRAWESTHPFTDVARLFDVKSVTSTFVVLQ